MQQINRNVELIRYKLFGGDLLMLELVNVVTSQGNKTSTSAESDLPPLMPVSEPAQTSNSHVRTNAERLAAASPSLRALHESVCDFMEVLGDEVQRKELKLYTAFKKIRNFVCVVIASTQQNPHLKLYLNLDPDTVELLEGMIVDARNKGHWGTGDLELTIRTIADWDLVRPLVERAYQEN